MTLEKKFFFKPTEIIFGSGDTEGLALGSDDGLLSSEYDGRLSIGSDNGLPIDSEFPFESNPF